MTDKQIKLDGSFIPMEDAIKARLINEKDINVPSKQIIDGVDVSGCKHRCDTHKTLLADGHIMEFANYCQITNDGCYAIDCYYKQLKAKEQECEQLKAELELFKTSNQTTIDQLKAENEDLKKSVLQECPNCGEEYLNYKGAALYFENSDLKQTLTEIKEIAEDTKDKFYKAIHTGGLYDRLEQIIRKINEVEE